MCTITLALLLVLLVVVYYSFMSEHLAVKYQPSQLAYATFEDAHKHRLRSTVKDSSGLSLSDYALENALIQRNAL